MPTISRRDRAFFGAAAKLAIFCLVSVVVTTMLAMIMGRLGAGGKTEYQAMFTTASQLSDGRLRDWPTMGSMTRLRSTGSATSFLSTMRMP